MPAAPTGVVANAGDRQVSLTWTAPADSGGSPVTSYVASVSSAEGIYPVTGIAGTTTTITGLHNGTAYTFTVAATNTGGTGPSSAPVNTNSPPLPLGCGV